MSKSEEIVQKLRDDGHMDATLMNTVCAPLGSVSEDMYAVRFSSIMPPAVEFTTYQASATLLVSIDGNQMQHIPLTPSPGPGYRCNIPPGTQHFHASLKDVEPTKGATYAMIVSAF